MEHVHRTNVPSCSRALAKFARGARLSVPVVMGYAPIGLAYGVIARQSGLSPAEAVLMSVLVYAGSAQFIACGLISSGGPAAGIVGTTFLVNLRHVLYSMSLMPRLRHMSGRMLAFVAFGITDETYGVAAGAFPQDEPVDWREIAGLNVVSYVAWVGSSLAGALLGSTLGDGERLGMDFALPAMFICLLAMQLGNRVALIVAVVAAVIAVRVAMSPLGSWSTVVAAVCAASVGTVLDGRAWRSPGIKAGGKRPQASCTPSIDDETDETLMVLESSFSSEHGQPGRDDHRTRPGQMVMEP